MSLSELFRDQSGAGDPQARAAISIALSNTAMDHLLTEQALPVINSVLRRRLRGWRNGDDADDVRSEVLVRLLKRLRIAQPDDAGPIENFCDYVAVVTTRAVDDMLRQKFPRRAQLKNRIRYVMGHDPRFTLSTVGSDTFCSLSPETSPSQQTVRHPAAVKVLADQIAGVLRSASPLDVDSLVDAVAAANGIVEENGPAVAPDAIAVGDPDPLARAEMLDSLRALWSEIAELPAAQRTALLLNLRDAVGSSPISLLPLLGIARIVDIAAAAGVETGAFIGMWNRLPVSDAEISGMLGLSRQQVINLRKAARDRLYRRMALRDKKGR